jgi:anti-sigma B factor antagonist
MEGADVAEPAQESKSRLETEPGRCVIALHGEWDLYNRPELERALRRAELSGEQVIVIDLSQATFIDSSVLGALVEARKRLAEGSRIAVVAADRQIRKVFEITGLASVFTLHETLEELRADLTLQSM